MYGSFSNISGFSIYNDTTPIGEFPSNIHMDTTPWGIVLFRDQNAWKIASYYPGSITVISRKIYIYGNATNIKSCNNVTIFLAFISTT